MKNAISGGFRQAANIWMFLVPVLTAAIIMMNFVDPYLPGNQLLCEWLPY